MSIDTSVRAPGSASSPAGVRGGSSLRVSLFVTCIVDQIWPAIGVSCVEILRRLGCSVEYDPRQTCCGQPAFNTGYREEARSLARRLIEGFEQSEAEAFVVPSGSCTAMIHHYPSLFQEEPAWRERAQRLVERTHELSSFLVHVLGVEDVGASFPGRVGWHDACHALRDLGLHSEPRRLLGSVRGAELVELPNGDACCGFGGTFSVKFPEISAAMLDRKIDAIEAAGLDAVVALDASCLMQIGGRLSRRGSRTRAMHLAEVLASTG